MSASGRRRVLAIVATDSTFELVDAPGGRVWSGKCLHCGSRLAVSIEGELLGTATVEHIVPRGQGGNDDLENLGLACARCNQEKGRRHDVTRHPSARALEIIARLQQRRRERWREL